MTDLGVRVQQISLAGLLPLAAIVFWPSVADPVNLPKATLAAVVAVVTLLVGCFRVAAARRLTMPLGPPVYAALAFAVALLIATVLSDSPAASVAGVIGRSDGLILYLACAALFVVGVWSLDLASARWLLRGLLVGGLFAVGYGVLQRAHLDPINWADVGISPIIGTFGNPDFESGYLGIVVPAAAWGALTRSWAAGWRYGAGVLAVSCLVLARLSTSNQGLIAGASGLVVLAVAVLLERGGQWARRGVVVFAAVCGVLGAVTVVGLATGTGPGARLVSSSSLAARKWYWRSALGMWRHRPVSGVGLDRYGAYYRSVRPAGAAAVDNYSDAAHSVPLQHLATGGLLLAMTYLAFVLAVGWALVQGFRSRRGEERLLLAGLGGVWLAYQVQSLVSIDQPGLAVTHWVIAAGVVAAAVPVRLAQRLLPGAVQPKARRGRSAKQPLDPVLVWTPSTFAACAAGSIIAVLLLWFALQPLRASYDVRKAAVSLSRGDGNAALAAYDAASRVAPYQASYWLQRGQFLEEVKQSSLAAASFAQGVKHDPRAYDVLVAGARLAKAQGDQALLARYERMLGKVDPSGTWRSAVNG